MSPVKCRTGFVPDIDADGILQTDACIYCGRSHIEHGPIGGPQSAGYGSIVGNGLSTERMQVAIFDAFKALKNRAPSEALEILRDIVEPSDG